MDASVACLLSRKSRSLASGEHPMQSRLTHDQFSALPHDGGPQPQAEAALAGSAPEEALQALGTASTEGGGLGA